MRDTYEGGYTKALLDVKNWFESHSESIKYCRLYNEKGVMCILKLMLDNREEFMKWGEDLSLTVPPINQTMKNNAERAKKYQEKKNEAKSKHNFGRDL